MEEFKLKDIKYGLIAIDSAQEDDEFLDILHFCGYKEKPTQHEADELYKELSEDEEFGLTDIIDRIIILPAPDDIVESYKVLDEEE